MGPTGGGFGKRKLGLFNDNFHVSRVPFFWTRLFQLQSLQDYWDPFIWIPGSNAYCWTHVSDVSSACYCDTSSDIGRAQKTIHSVKIKIFLLCEIAVRFHKIENVRSDSNDHAMPGDFVLTFIAPGTWYVTPHPLACGRLSHSVS